MGRHLIRVAESRSVGLVLLILVIVFSLAFAVETLRSDAPVLQEIAFLIAGGALAYGALVHVLCHYGYVCRLQTRRTEAASVKPAPRHDVRFGALIPSYREEPEFVYRAMLSVALQRTERKWLRLLIDDLPDPQTREHEHLLVSARDLPGRVSDFLAPLEQITRQAEANALHNCGDAPSVLARTHRRLAFRFARLARDWPDSCADDCFFRSHVLAELAVLHMGEATNVPAEADKALAELVALRARFECDVASFERKAFGNLSHTANKAMNLNTGLDLIGKRLTTVNVAGERHLREDSSGEVLFPHSDFVITLDADSLLAPSYASTLLAIAAAEDAEDVAVVQTPYASLPEPASRLERIAGATTDVQRITHQGFHYFDAAFWVGANAVLRVSALRDIAVEDEERGHLIRRYIQDRTPIEDTESTIDLAVNGWRVHNHDAVLAWSATPPDFGALVIQRRRWACGGLIVLPKAFRAVAKFNGSWRAAVLQLLIRGHYLGSLMWVPLALLVLLLAPFEDSLAGIFLPLVAVPYFIAYGLDLLLSRRPVRDLVQVYGLNLLLIPINLAGAFASLRQAMTGRKVPFARTPKVKDRTATPASILLAIWGGCVLVLLSASFDVWLGNENHAIFAAVNGAAMLTAAFVFIGAGQSREDISATFERFRRQTLPKPVPVQDELAEGNCIREPESQKAA